MDAINHLDSIIVEILNKLPADDRNNVLFGDLKAETHTGRNKSREVVLIRPFQYNINWLA